MQEIVYTVTATLPNSQVADEWLDWLREGHIAEILAEGATSAEIIALDQPDLAYEVRYHFPTRQAFERYEQKVAPALRAEGLKRFPPEKGITYRRSTGAVLSIFPG